MPADVPRPACLSSLDRRRLLVGAAGFAMPALAQTPLKKAEISFEIDEDRLRALFGRRLREGFKRLFPDGEILADAAGAKITLRRPEDFSALAAVLPRLDPAPKSTAEPAQGLKLTKLADKAARIDFGAAALDAQAGLWRDRAKKMLEQALAPRKVAFADKEMRKFVLTVVGMDRAQWGGWIGGRIDLFFPAPFALAPVAAAPGPKTFAPRPFPRGGPDSAVVVEGDKLLGNEDDIFSARVEGKGSEERLVLELTRPGADLFAAKNLPAADKAAYALMFDRAVAARAVLDGPARDGRMRLNIEQGLGAADLAERILAGGSAPMVRQVEARFG
ncbi:hypothetical protein GGD83_002002 [Rhodoblastus sphagnicola]|nr:hypothetical protein [Rhodoblastus sphagnicola]MBB4198209.1 hypothetical protein [Rhodoblastus sphagnicola]